MCCGLCIGSHSIQADVYSLYIRLILVAAGGPRCLSNHLLTSTCCLKHTASVSASLLLQHLYYRKGISYCYTLQGQLPGWWAGGDTAEETTWAGHHWQRSTVCKDSRTLPWSGYVGNSGIFQYTVHASIEHTNTHIHTCAHAPSHKHTPFCTQIHLPPNTANR